MARRLWMWLAAAYVLSPIGILIAFANFVALARRGFVDLRLEGNCLVFTRLRRKILELDRLRAIDVRPYTLAFISSDFAETEIGRFGIMGGTEAVIDKMINIKPDLLITGQSFRLDLNLKNS